MNSEIALDHCGAICHDFPAGTMRWRKLGFALTPAAQQSAPASEGHAEVLATANCCAMFQRGYLELIGETQPDRRNPWSAFLSRFEGIHLVALRCDNADDFCRKLRARGGGFAAPTLRTRMLTQNGETKELRFRSSHSDDTKYPEGRFIIIEHETPDLVWQPQYLVHPNTAIALTEVVIACAEIDGSARRLSAITGIEPRQEGEQAMCFDLAGGTRVVLARADELKAKFAHAPAAVPSCYGVAVAFKDRNRAVSVMQANGARVHVDTDGTPWVPPAETNGFVMQLLQA